MEIIHATAGTSIGGGSLTGRDEDYRQFIHFSLSCLTTLGFGDVYPVHIAVKMLSGFLGAVGILFPAIVIARLVGLANQQQVVHQDGGRGAKYNRS